MKTDIFQDKHVLIKLTNDDAFEVAFCTLGASIYSIKLDDHFMTLSPSKLDDFYKNDNYHGKTIGRFANRFKGNILTIDGNQYQLRNNEGDNVLHGGIDGLSTKDFEYDIDCFEDGVYITFYYLSKDGDGGYPGNVNFKVRYTVFNKKNSIEISYEAKTDAKTLWSITNHAFYSLGEDNCEKLKLTINSKKYLHPNPIDLLPLEVRDIIPCLDFSNGKLIGKDINDNYLQNSRTKGYDHYYFFTEVNINKPQFVLESNFYKLDIYTDFPGGQIYSDNYSNDISFYETKQNLHRGLAIEPGNCQNTYHYLDKSEEYLHKIILNFYRK